MRLTKVFQSTMVAGCAAALLCATPLLATQQEVKTGGTLLQEIKADAQTVETHATELGQLAMDPNTKWAQLNQKWNEIKPAQEELQMKIRRLESMRASLSAQQRKALDQSKGPVRLISTRTRELYRLMNRPGVDLTASPRFHSYAQSLSENADTLASTSAAGV